MSMTTFSTRHNAQRAARRDFGIPNGEEGIHFNTHKASDGRWEYEGVPDVLNALKPAVAEAITAGDDNPPPEGTPAEKA